MKANTSNRVALLSIGLLFVASFQASNALSPISPKNSTAEKAESVAASEAVAPLVKDVQPVTSSSPVTSSLPKSTPSNPTDTSSSSPSPRSCSSPGCAKCGVSDDSGKGTCTECKKGYVLRAGTNGRRPLSRSMLQPLQHRRLRFDPLCQPCGSDGPGCQDLPK